MDLYLPKGTNITDFANDTLVDIVNALEDEQEEYSSYVEDFIDDLYDFIGDEYEDVITVDQLLDKLEILVDKHKSKLL